MTKVRENGATTGMGLLPTYGYDNLGNRTLTTFGNDVVQSSGYDPVSRLISLGLDFAGTANDLASATPQSGFRRSSARPARTTSMPSRATRTATLQR